jgi:hypothetical protein
MLQWLRPRAALSSASIRVLVLSLIGGTLVATAVGASAAPEPVVLINTGGPAVTDVDGHYWQADKNFVGGDTGETADTITGTRYQNIFKDERYGMSGYDIPIANGTYTVKLLESEHYFKAPDQRVFDVKAEGVLEVDDLDVYARTGAQDEALYVVFTSTVTDGRLDLDFTASANYAMVDGIVIETVDGSPPPPPPSGGSVMWGMDDTSTFDATEANLGRDFALVRQYRQLDDAYATARQKALAESGHSLLISIRAETNAGPVKYSKVTSGYYDASLIAGLAKLNALPTVSYMIFHHEPDSNISKDSCASSWADNVCGPEFVAAWKHVYNLSKAHGYTNLRWAWTVTSYGFSPQTSIRNKYYWPGTAYTDWLGVDVYNGGCSGNWYGTFEEMLAKSIEWTKVNAPNKSILLPEWGATEGASATDKPDFFNDVPAVLTKPGYNMIKGMTYWNNKPPDCDFRINTSTASYNAFKSLGLRTVMGAQAPSAL